MKKKLTIFMVLILALGLVGCGNSIVRKSIEEAKLSIESKDYDKALASLQTVLDEDSDNEEGKKLYSIVDSYQKSKKSFEDNNVDESKKLLDEINDEYVNYMIKDDIDSLKQQVENKIKEIELINSNLTKLLGLVDEEKYDEANTLFEEINKNSLNDEQKNKANELKTRIDTELAEIEAQKKAEEEVRLAEEAKRLEEEKRKQDEILNSNDESKSEFTEKKAMEYLQKYYMLNVTYEDGFWYFVNNNGEKIFTMSKPILSEDSNGKYYSVNSYDVSVIESGGRGYFESGKIYENGECEGFSEVN